MSDQKHPALSRRNLLVGSGIVGLGAISGGFGLLRADTAFAADGQPQKGGILSFNISGDPPNLDILSNTSGNVINAIAPCYNGLVQFDPMDPDKLIGDLAESWELGPDGKSYTFRLVKGVRFHDGQPMTSEDVKFTFDVMRAPPAGFVSA